MAGFFGNRNHQEMGGHHETGSFGYAYGWIFFASTGNRLRWFREMLFLSYG
jgi:hypothetical protein